MPDPTSVLAAKRLEAEILAWLDDGRLGIGDRVPTERELCTWYGITDGTVRVVMIRLSAQGYLRGEHGHGWFVRKRPPR